MATILEKLNEDCWRLVLDLLPTKDIVRSERVSRGWQDVVYRYLQGVGMSLEYTWYIHKAAHSHRILKMEEDDSVKLKELTRKWGPCIKITDCINDEDLEVIQKTCPNLEEVEFYDLHDDALLDGLAKNFKRLKRVHFRSCNSLTDKCVKHWLENHNIEVLTLWREKINGKCLVTPHATKLKSLRVKYCELLRFNNLLSASKHLTHLKKLELSCVPRGIFQNVHTLLDQLPNLEDLSLIWLRKIELGDDWAESIGRLRLRRLDVSANPNVNDEWLEKASCGFGRLNKLLLVDCDDVTGRGAKAACRVAGPALQYLHLGSDIKIYDADVEEIVRTCPNLVWFKLPRYRGITNNIVERVANARSVRDRKLRLIVEGTDVKDDGGRFPWLIVDFDG